jgi:hypothetical protein
MFSKNSFGKLVYILNNKEYTSFVEFKTACGPNVYSPYENYFISHIPNSNLVFSSPLENINTYYNGKCILLSPHISIKIDITLKVIAYYKLKALIIINNGVNKINLKTWIDGLTIRGLDFQHIPNASTNLNKESNIKIISFDVLKKYTSINTSSVYKVLIVDDMFKLKFGTLRSDVILPLIKNAAVVVLTTSAVFESNIESAFIVLNGLNPKTFFNKQEFVDRYSTNIIDNFGNSLVTFRNVLELELLIGMVTFDVSQIHNVKSTTVNFALDIGDSEILSKYTLGIITGPNSRNIVKAKLKIYMAKTNELKSKYLRYSEFLKSVSVNDKLVIVLNNLENLMCISEFLKERGFDTICLLTSVVSKNIIEEKIKGFIGSKEQNICITTYGTCGDSVFDGVKRILFLELSKQVLDMDLELYRISNCGCAEYLILNSSYDTVIVNKMILNERLKKITGLN